MAESRVHRRLNITKFLRVRSLQNIVVIDIARKKKKIHNSFSETTHCHALHTTLNFTASLGPTSFSICISRSVGTRSNAPKPAVSDGELEEEDDDVDSELETVRLDTNSHTFLINVVMVFSGPQRLASFFSTFAVENFLGKIGRENFSFHGNKWKLGVVRIGWYVLGETEKAK
ncbi:hypothetical protein C1H46_033620 [Malus baccata]|uniref:Uncharacterized protein n=1 Tax=Malus baccata TaxID=106549 RepID=A0A540L2X2_MALBA|nr:hypothetical protein C1H46_033620 [Malus baccata]